MHKLLAVLSIALLLPAALPAVAAQTAPAAPAPAGPVVLLQDELGDPQVHVQGNPGSANGRWAASDLKALAVEEKEDVLTFTLTVGSLKQSPEAPFAESTDYLIGFLERDRVYRVEIFRSVGSDASYFSIVQAYDEGRDGYFNLASTRAVKADVEAGTLTVSFPREVFLDGNGNAPHPEVPLVGWNVEAGSQLSTEDCAIDFGPTPSVPCPGFDVSDTMPNQGNGTLLLPIRFGIAQTGHARLQSDSPVRASDGEATTFIFEVKARNLSPREDTFDLAATGVPATWQVTLPAQKVRIPGNGTVLFPVLVTTPFAHQHGTLIKFRTELRSRSDGGSVGRIELGVRYVKPPQPTGHHDVIRILSQAAPSDLFSTTFFQVFRGAPANSLYMNAADPGDPDPNDAQVDVAAETCGLNIDPTPKEKYCWRVPLSPGLELGLDFDLTRSGSVTLPVKTLLPLQSAVFDGYLVRFGPAHGGGGRGPFGGGLGRDATVVADVVPTPAVDIPANSAANRFATEVVPRPAGDYIPFEKGASLVLVLNLTFVRVDPFFGPHDMPAAQPGGVLQVPLSEYHDRVTTFFASNSTVALSVASLQDRLVNPGKSAYFNVTIENKGRKAADFDLAVTGNNAAWAAVITPAKTPLHLAAGAKADVGVVVVVPADARQDETCDLVLTASRADDLNVRALVRLLARVDTKADHADDGYALPATDRAHTPGLGLFAVAGALAAALLAMRRRQA